MFVILWTCPLRVQGFEPLIHLGWKLHQIISQSNRSFPVYMGMKLVRKKKPLTVSHYDALVAERGKSAYPNPYPPIKRQTAMKCNYHPKFLTSLKYHTGL